MMDTQTQDKTQIFGLDSTHTTAEFVVRHLMITKVRGRFTKLDGRVEVGPGGDLPTAVSATIDAGSIDTREEQRDAHLRSTDFFDVEKFPTLTFESARIYGSPDDFTIDGKLTIRGVTRDVSLAAEFEGRANDPWGGTRIGYSAAYDDQPQRLRPRVERGARDRRGCRRRRGKDGPQRRGRATRRGTRHGSTSST